MADIFISYARKDRPQVAPLGKALLDQGWSVFWDRVIPGGKTWDEVIEEELDAAKCVVVVWSINGVSSRWVRAEAEEGLNKNILVPVSIENLKPPLLFRPIQAVPLTDWNEDSTHRQFKKLIADLESILGPSPLKTKAAERQLAEEEAKKKAEDELKQREAERLQAEENEKRRRAEEEAKQQEEERLRAEEKEAQRKAAEEKQRAEAEQKAEEKFHKLQEVLRLKSEKEAKKNAETDAKQLKKEQRQAIEDAKHAESERKANEIHSNVQEDIKRPAEPGAKNALKFVVAAGVIIGLIVGILILNPQQYTSKVQKEVVAINSICIDDVKVEKDITPKAELSDISCSFKEWNGVETLHLTVAIKNISQEYQRYKVQMFLDNGKAVGGLIPRNTRVGLIRPGTTASFTYPVSGMVYPPKSVFLKISTSPTTS